MDPHHRHGTIVGLPLGGMTLVAMGVALVRRRRVPAIAAVPLAYAALAIGSSFPDPSQGGAMAHRGRPDAGDRGRDARRLGGGRPLAHASATSAVAWTRTRSGPSSGVWSHPASSDPQPASSLLLMQSKVWPIILFAVPSISRAPTEASVPGDQDVGRPVHRRRALGAARRAPCSPSRRPRDPGAWPWALSTARSGAFFSATVMSTTNLAEMNPTPTFALALKWSSSIDLDRLDAGPARRRPGSGP